MHKKLTITLTLLVACVVANAQWHCRQEADTSLCDVRFSTGMTVASGFGRSDARLWVAPRVAYRPSERLTIKGGFAVTGSMLGGYELHGLTPRSLAPRKHGTRLGAVHATAEYQANDRLWMWGSVALAVGQIEPLWLDGARPVQLSAFSGGIGYRFDNGSSMEMELTFVRSRGIDPLWLACPYHYGLYGTPFDIGMPGMFGMPMYP